MLGLLPSVASCLNGQLPSGLPISSHWPELSATKDGSCWIEGKPHQQKSSMSLGDIGVDFYSSKQQPTGSVGPWSSTRQVTAPVWQIPATKPVYQMSAVTIWSNQLSFDNESRHNSIKQCQSRYTGDIWSHVTRELQVRGQHWDMAPRHTHLEAKLWKSISVGHTKVNEGQTYKSSLHTPVCMISWVDILVVSGKVSYTTRPATPSPHVGLVCISQPHLWQHGSHGRHAQQHANVKGQTLCHAGNWTRLQGFT